MKKLKELKLEEIEVLDNADLRSYGYEISGAYDMSGSSGNSGSGESGGYGWFDCPEDNCKDNGACGSGGVCETVDCPGRFNPFTYKRCRDMDFRESDCNGKGLCEDCKWWNHVSGEYRDGKCSSWSGWPTLKCTDTCRS